MKPQEGSNGELPLVRDVPRDWEAILVEQAVKLPLRHGLVVGARVARVVQRHLEVPAPLCGRVRMPVGSAAFARRGPRHCLCPS